MSSPTAQQVEALLDAARDARERAYAPYSGFHVGAAVLDDRGRVFAAANLENASYPLSVCAERNAVGRAAFEGARRLEAVAVTSSGARIAWPCGGCRQVLNEFGPDLVVIVEGPQGEREQRRLRELLPEAFGPSDLGVRSPSGPAPSRSGRATPPDPPDLDPST